MLTISKFSGKCDFCDTISMLGERDGVRNFIENSLIYIGASETPLSVSSEKDLIQYYPYIIVAMYSDNVLGKHIIRLSSESYVDREERSYLEYVVKWLNRIRNRCMRKHITFDIESAVEEVIWNRRDAEQTYELVNRVSNKGKRASIEGIHMSIYEHYRKDLADEMIKEGVDPARYGYERFMEV